MSHTTHSPLTDRTTSYDSVQDHKRIYLLLDRFISRNFKLGGEAFAAPIWVQSLPGSSRIFLFSELKACWSEPHIYWCESNMNTVRCWATTKYKCVLVPRPLNLVLARWFIIRYIQTSCHPLYTTVRMSKVPILARYQEQHRVEITSQHFCTCLDRCSSSQSHGSRGCNTLWQHAINNGPVRCSDILSLKGFDLRQIHSYGRLYVQSINPSTRYIENHQQSGVRSTFCYTPIWLIDPQSPQGPFYYFERD